MKLPTDGATLGLKKKVANVIVTLTVEKFLRFSDENTIGKTSHQKF